MKESGFFAEPTDPESARAVFKEAFGFAAGAAKGGCASGLRQAGRIPSLGVAFSSRAGSNTPPWTSSPRFFERCEGVDSKHVRSCLEDYLATFHPDGPAARKAIECIEGIRHATFRDADVPGMVETIVAGIVPGDGSRGLSFDVYPDVLRAVKGIAGEFADAFPEGVAPLVKAMESSIGRDPESAVRSIGKNRVEWQEIPFDSSEAHEIPALEEVDRLRESRS